MEKLNDIQNHAWIDYSKEEPKPTQEMNNNGTNIGKKDSPYRLLSNTNLELNVRKQESVQRNSQRYFNKKDGTLVYYKAMNVRSNYGLSKLIGKKKPKITEKLPGQFLKEESFIPINSQDRDRIVLNMPEMLCFRCRCREHLYCLSHEKGKNIFIEQEHNYPASFNNPIKKKKKKGNKIMNDSLKVDTSNDDYYNDYSCYNDQIALCIGYNNNLGFYRGHLWDIY